MDEITRAARYAIGAVAVLLITAAVLWLGAAAIDTRTKANNYAEFDKWFRQNVTVGAQGPNANAVPPPDVKK